MQLQAVGATRRGFRRAVASGAVVVLSGAAVLALGSNVNLGATNNYTRACVQGLGERHIAHLNAPLVDIALTGSGRGCWLVAADGGVFGFGDARYYGSASDLTLVSPVVGLVPTPDDHGYWLYSADGGVFNFGDAGFSGSAGGSVRANPIVDMSVGASGHSYSLTDSTGKVYRFADHTPAANSVRPAKAVRQVERKAARKSARRVGRKAAHVHLHLRR